MDKYMTVPRAWGASFGRYIHPSYWHATDTKDAEATLRFSVVVATTENKDALLE